MIVIILLLVIHLRLYNINYAEGANVYKGSRCTYDNIIIPLCLFVILVYVCNFVDKLIFYYYYCKVKNNNKTYGIIINCM